MYLLVFGEADALIAEEPATRNWLEPCVGLDQVPNVEIEDHLLEIDLICFTRHDSMSRDSVADLGFSFKGLMMVNWNNSYIK